MNKLLIIIAMASVLVACKQQEKKAETDSKPETPSEMKAPESTVSESATVLTFPENSSNIEISGHMNGLKDLKTYSFEAKAGQKLTATLEPATKPANIRFNQIITPSGTTDGPFDITMTYDLKESGQWKLIVGGSNMQGDDYVGDYTLKVVLK